MTAHVRHARRDDAHAIARIHVASWRAAYREMIARSYLDRMSVRELARRRQRDTDRVWVAEVDRSVVGFAELAPCCNDESLAGFAGEVTMLYVHPNHTGDGVGKALLGRAFDELARQQFFWVVVWVLERNLAARSFYARRGLRPDGGRYHDVFDGARVSVVRYAGPINTSEALDVVGRILSR